MLFNVEAPSTRRVSRKTVAPPIEAVVLTDKSASATIVLLNVATSTTPNLLFNETSPSTRRVSRNTVAPPIESVALVDISESTKSLPVVVISLSTTKYLFIRTGPATSIAYGDSLVYETA